MNRTNELGQPIGDPLPDGWAPPVSPSRVTLEGQYVHVVPLEPEAHAEQLFEANRQDTTGAVWTYMVNGPYDSFEDFSAWLTSSADGSDPLYSAYLDARSGEAVGYGSYMRIKPNLGCIEVGGIQMSPLLQRTPMSTEAMHLMMAYVFDLGYRRYEWKCDALNAPSCRAAERLGFTFEGIFRKGMHYKGRSRDTAWYSIIDDEWPMIRDAQKAWLDPSNFDGEGQQMNSLTEFMKTARLKT